MTKEAGSGMDDNDIVFRLIIAAGVIALVIRGRRIDWGMLAIALLVIAGLAVMIDKFFL